MKFKKKIKVLIVDDSIVFREILLRGIASDPTIEVVATANDPREAKEKIIKFRPDVMTCDVVMPVMNGIEFIRELIPKYPMPIVVVSNISDAVFDAMKAGAVDFITKPNLQSVEDVEQFIKKLIEKIKIASAANIPLLKKEANLKKLDGKIDADMDNKIIAIGASTGGTEAIYNILKALPADIPGIVIVQHIPAMFSAMFAERLNNSTKLKVKEAQTGDYLERGTVLIAPGNKQMIIKKIANRLAVQVFQGDKVNGHRPSVDVLFESVAKECGSNSIGIILTGMGYDGAKGLLAMRKQGARTIGQDKESSVVYGMPRVAYNIGAVEKQVPLSDIPREIFSMLNG